MSVSIQKKDRCTSGMQRQDLPPMKMMSLRDFRSVVLGVGLAFIGLGTLGRFYDFVPSMGTSHIGVMLCGVSSMISMYLREKGLRASRKPESDTIDGPPPGF